VKTSIEINNEENRKKKIVKIITKYDNIINKNDKNTNSKFY